MIRNRINLNSNNLNINDDNLNEKDNYIGEANNININDDNDDNLNEDDSYNDFNDDDNNLNEDDSYNNFNNDDNDLNEDDSDDNFNNDNNIRQVKYQIGEYLCYNDNNRRKLGRLLAILYGNDGYKLLFFTLFYSLVQTNAENIVKLSLRQRISILKLARERSVDLYGPLFRSELMISYSDMGYNAALIHKKIFIYELATYFYKNEHGTFTKNYLRIGDANTRLQ
ncbi:hypothetical protein RIR_jg28879.t1 [Rhizophagus irregularis DAOM 181602=DAOM 197198]|nr:hypothetical protein RIR_jg28879.t1 [Rhizophagus irregularis DAOM 181602=DAOM 197198]